MWRALSARLSTGLRGYPGRLHAVLGRLVMQIVGALRCDDAGGGAARERATAAASARVGLQWLSYTSLLLVLTRASSVSSYVARQAPRDNRCRDHRVFCSDGPFLLALALLSIQPLGVGVISPNYVQNRATGSQPPFKASRESARSKTANSALEFLHLTPAVFSLRAAVMMGGD